MSERLPDGTWAETIPPSGRPSSSSVSNEGRFAIGSVLGERFRVLGLLGRGGMGEVYRAHDLKLDQPVALKFLPEAARFDPNLLERFRGEVRIARQISHRNVCRVYDLGEIGGAPYIAMEYVDGEDLGSLLRRIGRLPGDKALDLARRLCAGLAAAHERGVLHRDLKPANVMIDGRGQVLIMDFGLAAVADAVPDVGSGTPAYMAPEQRDGREVTVRSDIYALGLVFAEMFTGQRPSADGRISTTTKDLDPAVERVIQRCLDPVPARRPASALDVARALPGGDPLAEALAAGETPSPEMVAASEDTGALSVRAAVLCLAFIAAGIVGALLLSPWTNSLRRTPFPDSPEILARKARDIARRAGYTNVADSTYGLAARNRIDEYARANLKPDAYRAFISDPRNSLTVVWFRQSPRDLATIDKTAAVSLNDPPPVVSDMAQVTLDAGGWLVSFNAVPPQQISGVAAKPVDWKPLFDAAGLDPSQWTPAEPKWTPLASFDEQAAWSGTFPGAPSIPTQIDAAAWRGRPVQFEIHRPWTLPARDTTQSGGGAASAGRWVISGTIFILTLAALLIAWRHFHQDRGDTAGALRLFAFTLACGMPRWLLVTHHVGGTAEIDSLVDGLGAALRVAGIIGVLYYALEPYVRRRWPQSLISLARLLNGRFNDPIVGGHLLVGTALGIGYTLAFAVRDGFIRNGVNTINLSTALGPGSAMGTYAGIVGGTGIGIALGLFFMFFLLRMLLRATWLAAVVVVLFGAAAGLGTQVSWSLGIFTALQAGSAVAILVSFGVLPMVVAIIVSSIVGGTPLTTDFSAWYVSSMLTALTIVLGLTLWSFRAALGGRTVLKADFLDA